MVFNNCITCAEDLVTSLEMTRSGFIEAALEKNRKAQPFIDAANSFQALARRARTPMDLLNIIEIRSSLLTASGLSDKAFKYFREEDKIEAITKMIRTFLEPAGANFVDELVYRYLLIKGDSLGGSMRNFVGAVAKHKLIRKVLSVLHIQDIEYQILKKDNKAKNQWQPMNYMFDYEDVDSVCAIYWKFNGYDRLLFFDSNIPLVNNNVDICLFDGEPDDFDRGRIVADNDSAIMFGELKGGIDPAGADEHWKTGNTALTRIRTAFEAYDIQTSFIAAAIEKKMSEEIWSQLCEGVLNNAANITVDEQLTNYCQWIIEL